MYVVKYRSTNPRVAYDWSPDGEPAQCDERTAIKRFWALLKMAIQGRVYGRIVTQIRIEDTRIPAPSSEIGIGHMLAEPCKHIMLSRYVADDYNVGPWADKVAA